MEQSKKKKIITSILGILVVIIALVGVTYAFFNYTRTGGANTVRTGIIHFNSSQSGILNVTNLFPMSSNDLTSANTMTVTVAGDTNYSGGLEYLITAEEVNVKTSNGKKVPLSLVIEVNDDTNNPTNPLGTANSNYFSQRGSTTSMYKVLSDELTTNHQELLVGYIAPFTGNSPSGVNGTISITAYIDEDRVAISDTYDGTSSDNMGTSSSWVDGRKVFTTGEWDSLSSTPISFKIKVESNEGIWVADPSVANYMRSYITSDKANIKEIYFIKMMEEDINKHSDLIDLTASGSNMGVVKGWLEDYPSDNTKKILYIASPGTTYFSSSAYQLFSYFTSLTKIEFNNINTSGVTDMTGMFYGCNSLTSLDLSSFNTSNVQTMYYMFQDCSSLTSLDLSSFNTSSVTNMWRMFYECSSLTSLDLSSFDTSNMTSMADMFRNCFGLRSIDLSSFDTSAVINMSGMFYSCKRLTTIYVSDLWNVDGVTSSSAMFFDCTTSLKGGNGTTWASSNPMDKTYAVIDTPAIGNNPAQPGYLTLKG